MVWKPEQQDAQEHCPDGWVRMGCGAEQRGDRAGKLPAKYGVWIMKHGIYHMKNVARLPDKQLKSSVPFCLMLFSFWLAHICQLVIDYLCALKLNYIIVAGNRQPIHRRVKC